MGIYEPRNCLLHLLHDCAFARVSGTCLEGTNKKDNHTQRNTNDKNPRDSAECAKAKSWSRSATQQIRAYRALFTPRKLWEGTRLYENNAMYVIYFEI